MSDEDESTFRWKTTLAESKAASIFRRLRNFEQLDVDDVAELVMSAVWDPVAREECLATLKKAEDAGLRYGGQIVGMKEQLRDAIPRSFIDPALTDFTSRLGFWGSTADEFTDPWGVYAPDLLIRNIRVGQFVRVWGKPRMGKTNVAFVMGEQWLAQGGRLFSNCRVDDPPEGFVHVTSVSHLLGAASKFPPWLFLRDEGGLGHLRAQATRPDNIEQDKLARLIGKLGGNFVYIDQRFSAPSTIEEFGSSIIHALKPGYVSVAFDGPWFRFKRDFRDFPKSRIEYDTEDPSPFRVDIDIDEVLGRLETTQRIPSTT